MYLNGYPTRLSGLRGISDVELLHRFANHPALCPPRLRRRLKAALRARDAERRQARPEASAK